jgi:hypothetical protein
MTIELIINRCSNPCLKLRYGIEIIGKRVKPPHCPATVNGDESRNNATDLIGKARRVK